MHATCSFDVSIGPDEVVAYLSDPRRLMLANISGTVVEESDSGPVRAGSWKILAFDQLRIRIEYTSIDAPRRIAASMTTTGRGSRGKRDSVVYTLSPAPDGGTRIGLDAETNGGWMPASVGRLFWPLAWRLIRRRMESQERRPAV